MDELKKVGIGVDIESVDRFKHLPFDENKNFYRRIFTKREIEYCLSKSNPYQHFTARFCAKEAFIKAVSQEIKDYTAIEVFFENNKPLIKWKETTALLSLAHEKEKAIAFVIASKK